jgi:MoaA/NifB/PqqE/SkfB family radical SAM enzyme
VNESPRPKRAYVNIARRCNARCVYCADWMNGSDPAVEHSVATLRSLIDDLRDLDVTHVTISGGEPLIRKDLWPIVEYINAAKLSWSLITNGTMLNRTNASRLLAHQVSHVNVSIDALQPQTLREVRGLSIDLITRNVLGLQSLIAGGNASVGITVIAVISRSTVRHLPELAEFCHANSLGLTLQPLHMDESGRDSAELAPHWPDAPAIADLEVILADLIQRKNASQWRIENSDAYLRAIPLFFRQGTFHPDRPCATGAVDIVIDTDLQVRPCWAMPPVSQIAEKTPLSSIVASQEYRDVRAAIAEGTCPGCLFACHLNHQLT